MSGNSRPGAMEQELAAVLARFATVNRASERHRLARRNPWVASRPAVDLLYDEVVRQARIDRRTARKLALALRAIAAESKDEYCEAQSLRACGHVLYTQARYPEAISHYEAAVDLLRRTGRAEELGRTLSSAIHALIYLGRYDQAFDWADEARAIFEARGDSLRLARLDTNVGNVFFRQDRFVEALSLYEKAYEEFRRDATPQDVAAALSNLAVCYTSLGRFEPALDSYRRAREHCERHGMPLLAAEADYNIAYLCFLRGEYQRAIALFEQARANCRRLRDPYHAALCELDQAELYLELNVLDRGTRLARAAYVHFGRLQMRYERAKALSFRAIAAGRAGQRRRALGLFQQARVLFKREENTVWQASIDLYRATVLFDSGAYAACRRLCAAALRVFSSASLRHRSAQCELLLARLDIAAGNVDRAIGLAEHAASEMDAAAVPALAWQAYYMLGRALESRGSHALATEAYRSAHSRMEKLRSQLRGQGLKITFLKDKLAVYESLVWLELAQPDSVARDQAAFRYIEQSKSRSLADLIAASGEHIPPPADQPSASARDVRELQEKLNFYDRQIELQELSQPASSSESLERLREERLGCEHDLEEVLRRADIESREFGSIQGAARVSTEAIQCALGPDSVLVEYYEARETLFACVLSRNGLRVTRLCEIGQVRRHVSLLQFQLAKFRLGSEYSNRFGDLLLTAAKAHLHALYNVLVAPLRHELDANHVVFVPHGFLHSLPFAALYDGERYLAERFSISSAPSASVYQLCVARSRQFANRSLVFGVADRFAPKIGEEVRKVAALLPEAELFMNENATYQRLRQLGPDSRFVHIATHGLQRQDNPMLSALRLGDSELRLTEVYRLHLPTDLVTLSVCGTGLQSTVGGDELVGLVRGFLYAGAQSVLVSLWDIDDVSTAEYMEAFYSALPQAGKAGAARIAMEAVRSRHPHPYYWAPFTLIGNPH